jgi:LytS/YehU family sensor histidine kinase
LRQSGDDEKAYYFNVTPGKYVFRVRVSNNTNGATAEKSISIIISPPWWQTGLAYSLYALLMVIAVILIDRIQKRKVIRKARELGRERELEMQALRAQMNPHFIFNCLSSINNFVLKNETEEASDYLTKFSRLIRTVLNNSKKSYIPMEDELEMLELYLEMEKLRFKDSFTYCIYREEKIDPSAIFIPPLLIQPFVENAIWHGLLHKAEPGRLDIRVKVEKNILICIIEDNGVGRSFARVSESKSVERKKSMGIQITRQRLSLINGNAEIAGNDFVIEDLIDDIGQAAGTKVILRLLYKEINDEII